MERAQPHELNGKQTHLLGGLGACDPQNFHFVSGFWDILDDVGAEYYHKIIYSPVVSMPSIFADNIPTGSSISLSLPTHYQQDNTSPEATVVIPYVNRTSEAINPCERPCPMQR